MTTTELIAAYRQHPTFEQAETLASAFSYSPALSAAGYPQDQNLAFRTSVVEELLPDFSLLDIHFIRTLFAEEMRCEKAIGHHDGLYLLCCYLFELGQLEDSFGLFDAKFQARYMDAGLALDREMMTVGHEVDDVIRYVQRRFTESPELKIQFPTMIEELVRLKEYPDPDSLADYRTFIRGYLGRA